VGFAMDNRIDLSALKLGLAWDRRKLKTDCTAHGRLTGPEDRDAIFNGQKSRPSVCIDNLTCRDTLKRNPSQFWDR
jgi:hypothetical protein